MSLQDCLAAARAAGFRADALSGETYTPLVIAVAIAGAESGYDAAATADTRGHTDLPPGIVPEYSVGPWCARTRHRS